MHLLKPRGLTPELVLDTRVRRHRPIRDVPRGFQARVDQAKSTTKTFPSSPQTVVPHHTTHHPPANSSGNIAPLERVKPHSRENIRKEETSRKSSQQKVPPREFANFEEKEQEATLAITNTHIGNLNAVPLEMLSPVLSDDAFQQKQQAKQQERQNHRRLFLHHFLHLGSDNVSQIAEVVAGRLALCGLFGSVFVSIFTGQTLPQQILAYPDNILLVAIVSLSFTAASGVEERENETVGEHTALKGTKLEFIPVVDNLKVEILIGRVAMVAFSSLLAWQICSFS